jgi:hypothetical protein
MIAIGTVGKMLFPKHILTPKLLQKFSLLLKPYSTPLNKVPEIIYLLLNFAKKVYRPFCFGF